MIHPLISLLTITLFVTSFAHAQTNSQGTTTLQHALTSKQCIACHTKVSHQWEKSDHSKAMSLPTPDSVLGDFSGTSIQHHQQIATFDIQNEQYVAKVKDNDDAKATTYPIKYTFGHFPLQQYLVETQLGRLQVLPFAWDSRAKASGGQRWYHNFSDQNIRPDDRLHWRQPLQNWNGMCADCHSDEVKRNYNTQQNTFNTTFSHVSVGCVSCHGSMPNHRQNIQNNSQERQSTADIHPHEKLQSIQADTLNESVNSWILKDNQSTVVWNGPPRDNRFMDTCYACHSLRTPITDGFKASQAFLEQFTPALVTSPNYHADGQIKEEVFVYGSFKQSKMHAAGVNCLDCHDAHTMQVKAKGNALCLQCHQASTFDNYKHTRHVANTQAAQCVSCHMPDTVYMGVDNRRDHSFKIPRPDLSVQFDTPNACIDCHQDKNHQWASDTLVEWHGKPKQLNNNQLNLIKLRHADTLTLQQILAIAKDSNIAAIDRASALDILAQTGFELQESELVGLLRHQNGLIRIAAAKASVLIAPAKRASAVSSLLRDELKSVRLAAVNSIVGLSIASPYIADYAKALSELMDVSKQNAWRGEGRVNLGNLHMQNNQAFAAEITYQSSLQIEPYFAPGYINLADIYRAKGREDLVAELLQKGIKNIQDSADLRYAYALHLIRLKQIKEAIDTLQMAMNLDANNAQIAYTYILAMDAAGNSLQALTNLKTLINKYNNNQQLAELGLYLAKKNNNIDDFRWFQTIRSNNQQKP